MAKQPKKTPEQITIDYERQLLANQRAIAAQVDQLYQDLVNQIAPLAAAQTMPDGIFTLEKLPMLNNRIDQLIRQLSTDTLTVVQNGIKLSWQLSNDKNNALADIRLDKSLIPADQQVSFYDTNAAALKQYLDRKINGLSLSDRIYSQESLLKSELEAGIGVGISAGESAYAMGRDLKQFLTDPNKLFRRVRDAKGELQLSKNAEAFNPGQGVYRNSNANIQRLTRTETNMSYRNADNARYRNMPFITGYEVRTSGSHPKLDVCDDMAGEYPVDFVFIGWHPQCLCFQVPILMNDQQFAKYQQLVIEGTATAENVAAIAPRVTDIPQSATDWMNTNADRIAGWKSPPLWMQQNDRFVP